MAAVAAPYSTTAAPHRAMNGRGTSGSTSTRRHLSIVADHKPSPETDGHLMLDWSFAAELVETTRSFGSDSIEDAVEEVVFLARRATDGCSFASCTTRRPPDGPTTIGATHPEALALDQLQYGISAGPCLHAIDTNEVVHVANLARDDRWTLGPSATHLAGSVLCVPFADQRRPDRAVGSLNLYAAEPDTYSGAAIATANLLATHLGALLTMATVIQQLTTGLESRDAIGQAKGILMAREGVTPDEAFRVLRRTSQLQNRKLRDVAAELALSTDTDGPPQ